MILAITSDKNDINSKIDDRFGRCNFFYIYDTLSKTGDFHKNPFKDENQGVGTRLVEFLANKSVEKIIAVEVGDKAKKMLDSLKMEISITDKNIIVEDIINALN